MSCVRSNVNPHFLTASAPDRRYMSQPKLQLSTFKAWVGISSDISYYLNSHHIDFHVSSRAGCCRRSVYNLRVSGKFEGRVLLLRVHSTR